MIDDSDDGYKLVSRRDSPAMKSVKCGECGMKFDHGKAYAYCCSNAKCPLKPTVGL